MLIPLPSPAPLSFPAFRVGAFPRPTPASMQPEHWEGRGRGELQPVSLLSQEYKAGEAGSPSAQDSPCGEHSAGSLQGACRRPCPPCGSGGDHRSQLPWLAGCSCPSPTPPSFTPFSWPDTAFPSVQRAPSPLASLSAECVTRCPAGQEGFKSWCCWASGANHSTSALTFLLCSVRVLPPTLLGH